MTEFETRYVQDHEEWLGLVERADCVYSPHGFMAFNAAAPPSSPRRLITDQKVVEKAVELLAREFGWGGFVGVAGPLTTEEAVFEGRYGEEPRYVGTESRAVEGGWWLVLPVDYHEYLHDQGRLEFRARAKGRDVALFARELAERRAGEASLKEFDYTVEYALVGRDICVYNNHPDAPEATRAMFEAAEEGRLG